MTSDELLTAVAYLSALEYPSDAERYAAQLPDWVDLVAIIRARDGAENLARAVDARQRATRTGATLKGTDPQYA